MGTTGLLAGPAVIGFIADATSLVWGMAAVAVSAAVVSLCATRIGWPAPEPRPEPHPEPLDGRLAPDAS